MGPLELPRRASGREKAREPRSAGLRLPQLRLELRLRLELGRRLRLELQFRLRIAPTLGLGVLERPGLGVLDAKQLLLASPLRQPLEVAADGVTHLVEMALLAHG